MKKYIYIGLFLVIAGLITWGSIQTSRLEKSKSQVADFKEQGKQKDELIKKLSDMEAVSVKISFEVKNTAVFGSIKNGDYKPLLEGALQYTRKDVLEENFGDKLKRADSLFKIEQPALKSNKKRSKNRFTESFRRADSLFMIEYAEQIKALYPSPDELNRIFIPAVISQ